jgi:hypothetical protein
MKTAFSITFFTFILTFTSCSESQSNKEEAYYEESSYAVLSQESEQMIKDIVETLNKTELDWKIQLLNANKISDRLYFDGSKGIVRIVNSRGFSTFDSGGQGFEESISIENQIEKPIGKIEFRFYHYDDYGDIRSSGKFEVLKSSKINNLTFKFNNPLLDSYEIGEINLNRVSSFPRVGKRETLILSVDSVYFHEPMELKFNQPQLPTFKDAMENAN